VLSIGLTGGIGAGKSTAAQTFRDLGAVVIDADAIARDVLAPGTAGLESVVDAFGTEVLLEDGSLDRRKLAARVFDDPVERRLLNAITHPLVYQEIARLVRAAPREAIIVQDIPLIVENAVAPRYHLVVVVAANERMRLKRLVGSGRMTEPEALARIHAQAEDAARRAVADVWLKNEGTAAELRATVENLWRDRLVPFNENLLNGRVASGGGQVRSPDRDWPAQAARLAARIKFGAGDLVRAVRHVGPTSRGEPSVDVIELEVDVRDEGDAELLGPVLAAAGFLPEPGSRLRYGNADPGRPARVILKPGGARVSGGTYR
jgi:dephospho-CoA kinase